MRFISLAVMVALYANALSGQFEQKLSLNLSGGIFNTVGADSYEPEPAGDRDEPTLMPNFKAGFTLSGGLQYNLNRHLSLEAALGVMISPGWYYDYSPAGEDPFNYLFYTIYTDTVTYIPAVEGENDLNLTAIYFSLAPRYYFLPGKKLNPYLFAGLNISYLDVYYQDNEYDAYEDLGRLEEYPLSPASTWYDKSINAGLVAGAGAEYGISDNLGVFVQFRYHYALLDDADFFESIKFADFHAISVKLGIRISFLKSKEL